MGDDSISGIFHLPNLQRCLVSGLHPVDTLGRACLESGLVALSRLPGTLLICIKEESGMPLYNMRLIRCRFLDNVFAISEIL